MTVTHQEMIPVGCVTADALQALARALNKLEHWHRRHRGKRSETPCLRLIQGARNGRITALVQSGDMTLKLALKAGEWIVLGDALKVSD